MAYRSTPQGLSVLSAACGLALGCTSTVTGEGPGQAPGSSGGSSSGAGGSSAGNGTGGSSAGTSGSAGTTTGGTGGIISDAACIEDGTLRIGRSRLRRLTRSQFNHTVRDLLGTTGTPADAVSPDESIGPFYSNAIAPITDLIVQQYDEVAASLANQAATRMSDFVPCDLTLDTGTTCIGQFVDTFGRRAYRRPLEPAERDEYLALYTLERSAGGTAESAFKLVVSTFLESPFFLYHAEAGTLGTPTSAPATLSSYEIASRISYFLWDTMPDDQLFSLAAAGTLADDAVLGSEVTRMLADPRAADAIPEFHVQWLGIREVAGADKDPAAFPAWSPAVAEAMRRETATFADFVVRRGDGLMQTLFNANFTFPEAPLFAIYGLTQPQGFAPGMQIPLNAERAGILTQGAFLAMHAHRDQTSPVHRGILVRENLLCEPLQPPPLDVNTTPPAPTPATTTRDRFARHQADPTCGGCHVMIDPIGLAFENFDAIGAYRTTENGLQIDPTGEIVEGQAELAGPFVGALELSQRLSQSRVAADCLANQWFRFALGRMEAVDDACSLKEIRQGFETSGRNVRELIVSIVKSDAFSHIRATE
jgi:hypothetical protein